MCAVGLQLSLMQYRIKSVQHTLCTDLGMVSSRLTDLSLCQTGLQSQNARHLSAGCTVHASNALVGNDVNQTVDDGRKTWCDCSHKQTWKHASSTNMCVTHLGGFRWCVVILFNK